MILALVECPRLHKRHEPDQLGWSPDPGLDEHRIFDNLEESNSAPAQPRLDSDRNHNRFRVAVPIVVLYGFFLAENRAVFEILASR
jgi:hypothetical protein